MSHRIAFAIAPFVFACAVARAQESAVSAAPSQREKELLERIRQLEQRIAAIEARFPPAPATAPPTATTAGALPGTAAPAGVAPAPAPAPAQLSSTRDSLSLPGFASGTTLNFLLDGYYEYNFNNPVGRVNLLRAYDPTSNNFTLNQAAVIIERAPDVAAGRRYGLRLDLMFGQALESLAANPGNEPRTAPYRNVYQAYGTYVFPLGSGLTVDFGRFSSLLGFESSFAKDQINYTRSLLFTALPFYHMGFRTIYRLGPNTTATWLIVNGLNQTEDFNGFKSNGFSLTTSVSKALSWTGSYYFGNENRTLVQPAVVSNLPPPLPTQPGLSTTAISPRPNGLTHIADSYFTLNATSKLTLVGEGDYIVSRTYSNSYPAHLAGGAAYSKYQFVPALYLAARFEYVSDHGYFSGITQALKDATATAAYQPCQGFQIRWELRRDYSNRSFFLAHNPGQLKQQQTTALIAFLWWFGGKEGSW
jgi:hypothetical protein